MPNVFVLIDGGHNYTPAEEFGNVQHLNLPASCAYYTGKAYALLQEGMKDKTPDDYIVISGPATLCCIATAIMVEEFGQVNFLLFSEGRYIPKTISTIREVE